MPYFLLRVSDKALRTITMMFSRLAEIVIAYCKFFDALHPSVSLRVCESLDEHTILYTLR